MIIATGQVDNEGSCMEIGLESQVPGYPCEYPFLSYAQNKMGTCKNHVLSAGSIFHRVFLYKKLLSKGHGSTAFYIIRVDERGS